jgi:hypothetical protein
VRICYTRDLSSGIALSAAQRACHSERVIMPPVRGEKMSDLLVQPSGIVERIINLKAPGSLISRGEEISNGR